MPFEEKVQAITVSKETTLLAAIQLMDKVRAKSLLVLEGDQFISLVSIGDVQRAIIRNLPLDTNILEAVKEDLILVTPEDSEDKIRSLMLRYRLEYMPVVDATGRLHKVWFWSDFFPEKSRPKPLPEKVPVVIMAGGVGSRLRPLTNIIPKPLVPIGEKPIVEVIVDKFHEIGVDNFYLTVNYKHEMIRFYFDSVADKSYTVEYALESKPLGTAGSLQLLKNRLKTTFFVTNCDIVIEDEYAAIYEYHKEAGNDITLVASLKNLKIPYGTVESGEAGELLGLKEKPDITFMINTGMYILEPQVLNEIPNDSFIHITEVIEKVKAKGGRVGVFPVSEDSWTDIGEWPEYQKIIERHR